MKPIRFKHPWKKWQGGERASFPDDEAALIVGADAAVYVEPALRTASGGGREGAAAIDVASRKASKQMAPQPKPRRKRRGPPPDPSPEGYGSQGEGYGPQGEFVTK